MELNREQIEAIQKSHWMVRDYIHALTEENERLRAKGSEWRGCADALFEEIKKAKANTVRKMQEETRQRCIIIGDEEYVTLCDLDQIAKEMLEEGE